MKTCLILLALSLLPVTCAAQSIRAAEQFNQRGVRLFEQGDLDGAIAEFDHLLELVSTFGTNRNNAATIAIVDPRAAHAYSNRGVARHNKGDLEGAKADFDRALRINPRLPEVWYNRGVLRQDQNDLDGALSDYNRAITLQPRHEKALFNRGELHLLQQSHEAAIADYSAVIKLNPRAASAYTNRGTAFYTLGKSAEARQDFDRAIALETNAINLAAALRNRGKLHLDSGDLERAIADFTAAIAQHPTFALAFANRGIAYLRQGNEPSAEADFAQCLKLDHSLEAALQEQIQKVKEQMKRGKR